MCGIVGYIGQKNTTNPSKLNELGWKHKIELEDGIAKADGAERADPNVGNLFMVNLHEGKNRQIRRMFEAIGAEVKKLERVRYAGLTSKGVRKGKWKRLTRDEVTMLYRKVKL